MFCKGMDQNGAERNGCGTVLNSYAEAKQKGGDNLYIPEFVCGFIVGAIFGVILLTVIALCADKHDKGGGDGFDT